MPNPTSPTLPKSLLERALSIVTDVERGEGVTALLLTLDVFMLLTSYYVIKPVREALILGVPGGAEYKSYMGAAIAIALLVAVPIYAKVAHALPRNRLLLYVNGFFILDMLAFFVAMRLPYFTSGSGALYLGLAFFLWVGVFNLMIVAQFWAFATDLYDEAQGKRLFALIGLGASLGAAMGSLVISEFVRRLGTPAMLLIGAAVLAVSGALTEVVHQREKRAAADRPSPAPATPVADEAGPRKGAFAMVFHHRYLLLIAVFSVIFTLVNTNGEYILSRLVKERSAIIGADAKEWIAAYYGRFFLYVNLAGLILQAFAVSRVIKNLKLRHSFLIFPLVALASASSVVLLPVLAIYRFGKTSENALDYSLNNTLRNTLWLRTTRDMKYVAKQAVDSFFVRFGDVMSALCVFVFADTLGVGVRVIGAINMGLVVVWIFVARGVARENEALGSDPKPDAPAIARPEPVPA